MKDKFVNIGIFVVLCLIWGSSFKLMKTGMEALSPYDVAGLRMISAGLVLLPFTIRAYKAIPNEKLKLVMLSGLLGSFFPAFLFCIAETRIDSSLAGILNALTPLFTIVVGISFFDLKINRQKQIGVLIGFTGLCLLFLAKGNISFSYIGYSLLVLLATILYGINVNIVARHLNTVGSLNIAAVAFTFLVIPSGLALLLSGYQQHEFSNYAVLKSTAAGIVLGVFGTAVASILFYMLVKRAGGLFASMVTYGIPFVAVFWGLLDGEHISALQVLCLGIILVGVYLANKPAKPVKAVVIKL
ncbi:DMT family transporter [Segetibacter sp. 3557_3]|uniref:DMT family transporter n=1 Tax=Segetibacter sp. 3557_3 TaxID=2547429 RepID=UPI0014046959|nr:DMT family transporter [Segetibacter sp. 3557_3]